MRHSHIATSAVASTLLLLRACGETTERRAATGGLGGAGAGALLGGPSGAVVGGAAGPGGAVMDEGADDEATD